MFFLNVLVSGLLAGLMYGMVAIGFVLIYKASGVFNSPRGRWFSSRRLHSSC